MMDIKINAMLGTLQNQRDQALNAIVQLAGENAELREQLKVANAELEKKKKRADLSVVKK